MYGRASSLPATACSMIGWAMLIGIAKPMPFAVRGDGRVDADDVAGRVEQRPAGVAGVDRGVGLDEVVEVRFPSVVIERPVADTIPLVTEFE